MKLMPSVNFFSILLLAVVVASCGSSSNLDGAVETISLSPAEGGFVSGGNNQTIEPEDGYRLRGWKRST